MRVRHDRNRSGRPVWDVPVVENERGFVHFRASGTRDGRVLCTGRAGFRPSAFFINTDGTVSAAAVDGDGALRVQSGCGRMGCVVAWSGPAKIKDHFGGALWDTLLK